MVASAYVPARVLRLPNDLDWWIVALLGLPIVAAFLTFGLLILFA
jgi:hypothetical protein